MNTKPGVLISLVVLAIATPAFASSIAFDGNGGVAFSGTKPGVYSYTYGYNFQNSAAGYNYMNFEMYNCCSNSSTTNYASGFLNDISFNSKTGKYLSVSGNLFDGVFNAKTDILTAQFAGLEYGNIGGRSTDYQFNGVFTEHINPNGTLGTGGLKGLNGGTTPEPGTLVLFGTGLIVAGGIYRKRRISGKWNSSKIA